MYSLFAFVFDVISNPFRGAWAEKVKSSEERTTRCQDRKIGKKSKHVQDYTSASSDAEASHPSRRNTRLRKPSPSSTTPLSFRTVHIADEDEHRRKRNRCDVSVLPNPAPIPSLALDHPHDDVPHHQHVTASITPPSPIRPAPFKDYDGGHGADGIKVTRNQGHAFIRAHVASGQKLPPSKLRVSCKPQNMPSPAAHSVHSSIPPTPESNNLDSNPPPSQTHIPSNDTINRSGITSAANGNNRMVGIYSPDGNLEMYARVDDTIILAIKSLLEAHNLQMEQVPNSGTTSAPPTPPQHPSPNLSDSHGSSTSVGSSRHAPSSVTPVTSSPSVKKSNVNATSPSIVHVAVFAPEAVVGDVTPTPINDADRLDRVPEAVGLDVTPTPINDADRLDHVPEAVSLDQGSPLANLTPTQDGSIPNPPMDSSAHLATTHTSLDPETEHTIKESDDKQPSHVVDNTIPVELLEFLSPPPLIWFTGHLNNKDHGFKEAHFEIHAHPRKRDVWWLLATDFYDESVIANFTFGPGTTMKCQVHDRVDVTVWPCGVRQGFHSRSFVTNQQTANQIASIIQPSSTSFEPLAKVTSRTAEPIVTVVQSPAELQASVAPIIPNPPITHSLLPPTLHILSPITHPLLQTLPIPPPVDMPTHDDHQFEPQLQTTSGTTLVAMVTAPEVFSIPAPADDMETDSSPPLPADDPMRVEEQLQVGDSVSAVITPDEAIMPTDVEQQEAPYVDVLTDENIVAAMPDATDGNTVMGSPQPASSADVLVLQNVSTIVVVLEQDEEMLPDYEEGDETDRGNGFDFEEGGNTDGLETGLVSAPHATPDPSVVASHIPALVSGTVDPSPSASSTSFQGSPSVICGAVSGPFVNGIVSNTFGAPTPTYSQAGPSSAFPGLPMRAEVPVSTLPPPEMAGISSKGAAAGPSSLGSGSWAPRSIAVMARRASNNFDDDEDDDEDKGGIIAPRTFLKADDDPRSAVLEAVLEVVEAVPIMAVPFRNGEELEWAIDDLLAGAQVEVDITSMAGTLGQAHLNGRPRAAALNELYVPATNQEHEEDEDEEDEEDEDEEDEEDDEEEKDDEDDEDDEEEDEEEEEEEVEEEVGVEYDHED
ncbi:hypothetical protein FRB94_014643 [Tulasnella sp. JGI-2019a]|nr:hypothetical protein FRB94_014643 [Tulasnella sp. JGI-2019a]